MVERPSHAELKAAAVSKNGAQAAAGGRDHTQVQQGIQHLIDDLAVEVDGRNKIAMRHARVPGSND